MAAPHCTCPTPEQLRAFGLGEPLDAATADEIARHLDVCEACTEALAGVSTDGFLDRRRAAEGRDGTPVPPGPLDGLARSVTRPHQPRPGPDPAADPAPADLADDPDYEVVRELGRGGMGVVYLARNRLMGRDEVLKVMGEGVTARPGTAARFRREIQSAARLDHRNVVRVYSARQMGDQLVLAMEYVPGDDLAALVKARGPLPVLNACYYAHQVALGLQHADGHGMVHRDIKPANLIVHRNGKRHTVKILDFGLAKVTSESAPGADLTDSGQMMGTPPYMAPEQARDAATADIRADIFSLGCTLYFLLTGAPPLAGGVLDVLAGERPKPLHEVRPEVSEELAGVVAKMMAKEAARRHQTPAEVVAALSPFLKPAPPQAEVPTAVPRGTAVGPLVAIPLPAPADPWGELTLSEPATLPAEHLPAAPPRRRMWKAWTAVVAGGLMAGLFAALAGGGLRVKTKDGVIVVEKLPPDADVLVDGETVTLSRKGDVATVKINRGGPHRLKVIQGGKEILSSDLTVTLGGEPVRVTVPRASAGAAPKRGPGTLPAVPTSPTKNLDKLTKSWIAGLPPEQLAPVKGFYALTRLGGGFWGGAERLALTRSADHRWSLGGDTPRADTAIHASAVGIEAPGCIIEEYEWAAGQAKVRMIRKDEGVCTLSGLAGNLLGGGEEVGVEVGEDGFWYLGGRSDQESLSAKAMAVRGVKVASVTEYTWRPAQEPTRLIRADQGVCFISGVGGAYRGGGEWVRVSVADDGFWYLTGYSLQPSVVGKAIAVQGLRPAALPQ